MRFVLLSLMACLSIATAGSVQSQGQTRQPQNRQPENRQKSDPQTLEREFQAAVAQYDSGKYAEAAVRLERILRQVPESFESHELLGLVYSAQSEDAKANPHLEKAVRLKPDSAAARTNLAANLHASGET